MDISWGLHKIGLYFGIIYIHFRLGSFLNVFVSSSSFCVFVVNPGMSVAGAVELCRHMFIKG